MQARVSHDTAHPPRPAAPPTPPPAMPAQAGPPQAEPPSAVDRLGRDFGLRTPDSVATPEMAEQAGMPIGVLRWLPLLVAALAAVIVAGVGLVVLGVL